MPDLGRFHQRLSQYMGANGLKHTKQREVIVDTFLEREGHIAIDDLLHHVQDRMSGVGYATVYRTMKLLVEAGVAHERQFGDGQTRYEPAFLDEHHDHIICTTCGHIFEFEDEVIEERQHQVVSGYGLRIVSHRHEIYGECNDPDTCEHRETATD